MTTDGTKFGVDAAVAKPCSACAHIEREHLWESLDGFVISVRGCWHREQLPRDGDEPHVRYEWCPCEKYAP